MGESSLNTVVFLMVFLKQIVFNSRIMGVILGAGCWYFKGSIQKMIGSNKKINVGEQNKQKGDGITKALECLNRGVWDRDKMEQIEELKGLWNALNEYNFEKVLSFEKSLSESNNFRCYKR